LLRREKSRSGLEAALFCIGTRGIGRELLFAVLRLIGTAPRKRRRIVYPTQFLNLPTLSLKLAELASLSKSRFFKNVLIVITGTGLAQLIGLACAPILTRVYDPTDFGLLACFLSIVSVIGAGVTLQYSQALMLPKSDHVAAGLFLSSLGSVVIITLTVALFCFLFPGFWPMVFRTPQLGALIYLIPVAVLISGVNQTLIAWCLRAKAFRFSAMAQAASAATKGGVQSMGGMAGYGIGGLIGGALVGDALANFLLWRSIVRQNTGTIRAALGRKVVSIAGEYRDFAFYSTPQNVLNAVSHGAPVILLARFYGIAVGGYYALAIRMLDAPVRLLLGSLRQVLFQKLCETNSRGTDLAPIFTKCTRSLFVAVIAPAVIGFVFAPDVFAFIFGRQWHVAGEYARWLLVWLVPSFCNLPAALTLRVIRRQRMLLFYDLALLAGRVSTLVLGKICFATPLATVIGFSCVGALFEAWLIWYAWRTMQLGHLVSDKNSRRAPGVI
jgi:O-antigen/teichoic acid export membrane protein